MATVLTFCFPLWNTLPSTKSYEHFKQELNTYLFIEITAQCHFLIISPLNTVAYLLNSKTHTVVLVDLLESDVGTKFNDNSIEIAENVHH